jgi:hypothetical protein
MPVFPDSNEVPELFLITYYFFPGTALPIIVLFLFKKHRENFALPYIVLSCAEYFAVVWMFSGERIWKGLPYVAAFIGAFLFLLLTKIFVEKKDKVFDYFIELGPSYYWIYILDFFQRTSRSFFLLLFMDVFCWFCY